MQHVTSNVNYNITSILVGRLLQHITLTFIFDKINNISKVIYQLFKTLTPKLSNANLMLQYAHYQIYVHLPSPRKSD